MAGIDGLPHEIVIQVMQYLPITCLLRLGITSKRYRQLQQCSLNTLGLGVFHSRLDGLFDTMESTSNVSRLHAVQIILPKDTAKKVDHFIQQQNSQVREIIPRYQDCLRSLELTMWDMQEETACLVAQLSQLVHLSIRLDHPHTRSALICQF